MANTDEINKKVDEETSFGTYVVKDLSTTAMIIGGMAAGAGVGYLASRWSGLVNGLKSAAKWVAGKLKPETASALMHWVDNKANPEIILPVVGTVVGSMAAAVPNTYIHWREGRKTQLRVEEMANDVVALREQRNTAMETLRQQSKDISNTNKTIQKIVEKGPKGIESITAESALEDQVDRLKKRAEKPSEQHRE